MTPAPPLLHVHELAQLSWLETDLSLCAHAPAQRAHPLVVLEAVLKGIYEAAGCAAHKHARQLWHCPGHSVHTLGWQAGSTLHLRVQLFGLGALPLADWQQQLEQRCGAAGAARSNFSLLQLQPWRSAQPASAPLHTPAWAELHLHTPVPLPHTPGQPRTALDPAAWLHLCQTRLRKLFGRPAQLPPAPELDSSHWHYWRTRHPSRSQGGHPMLINGCIGPLRLSGPQLGAWLPWLALLEAVGLGERLSFAQGRFSLTLAPAPAPAPTPKRAAARASALLRRPLHIDQLGAHLRLQGEHIVIEPAPSGPESSAPAQRLPLRALDSLHIYNSLSLSSPLLHACAQHGVPVSLSAPGAPPLLVLGGSGEFQRHQRLVQHHLSWRALSPAQHARLAASLVDAKLSACQTLVRQRYQRGDHLHLRQLQRARSALAGAPTLDHVRGWEGWAARLHFEWFGRSLQRIAPAFGWSGRGAASPSPSDPANALLNYGYALLRARIEPGLRGHGLDPWLGILHQPNGRHTALVSDLMEPLRPWIDRLVLRLLGLGRIQIDDFTRPEPSAALRMGTRARQHYLQGFARLLYTPGRDGGAGLQTRIDTLLRSYAAAACEADASPGLAHWQIEPEPLLPQPQVGEEDLPTPADDPNHDDPADALDDDLEPGPHFGPDHAASDGAAPMPPPPTYPPAPA